MSSDIFKKILYPKLQNNKQLIFIIIDCLRADQWKMIAPTLDKKFNIQEDYHLAILPTATPFARNAIFSGLLPLDLKNKYPDLWKKMFIDKYSKI